LTLSPDDGRIAYAIFECSPRPASPCRGRPLSADPGRQFLRILDVETGRQEVITRAYSAIHGVGPVWSPDGERIVYQRMVRTERHEVVILTPGDRSQETGLAREVVIPPDDIDTGLFPWRVTWSPDSKYLLYRAWSYPNGYPSACCGKEFVEQQSWVAVPADLDGPSVVLTDTDAGLAYDSPDTMRVPIQIWGRR
jgi:Tol biopolymer transport system component